MDMKIDDKIAQLGFTLVYDDIRSVHYERYNTIQDIYQTVYISYNAVLQNFQLKSYDELRNNCIALSEYEVKLFLKKMKQKSTEYARLRNWI